MTNVVPVRPAPPTPLAEIEKLAEAVAKSGMFGIRTREQALVLMAISQAEGRHPALAARDYDIIQGRPAKKAEAMLRDMLDSGGRVEWHELTDAVADATFSHPAGGKVRIRWDTEKARQAGLLGKEMYKKFPRAMMRSRCVSEGVKTVCPMATSGMYTPEEVIDIPTREPPPEPASVAAELDSFASAESGTPRLGLAVPEDLQPDADAVRLDAEAAAMRGTAAFRVHYKPLDDAERAILAPDMAEYRRIANEADAAAEEQSRDADPFGLLPVEPIPFVDAPAPELDLGVLPQSDVPQLLAALAPQPREPGDGEGDGGDDWQRFADEAVALIERATQADINAIALSKMQRMLKMRRESGDDYRRVQRAITARVETLGISR